MSHEHAPNDTERPHARRKSFIGRWFRRVPLLLGLLSVGLWLLPALLSTTPLRNFLIDVAAPELPKGVSVGSARLSWTEPVQFNDVSVEDSTGREVLHVDRIESEETLWQLATERLSRGLFHVLRPRLTLTIRERSKAIDPAVLKALKNHPAGSAGRKGSGFSLDLSNGEVALVNEAGELLTEITDVTVSFQRPPADGGVGTLELTGRVRRPETNGTLKIEAEWSGKNAADRKGEVHAELVRVPVDALNPRLRKQLPGRRLSGDLTCNLDLDWAPGEESRVLGNLDLEAALIELHIIPEEGDEGASHWSLTDSSASTRVALHPDGDIRVKELTLDSQPLQADVVGTISRADGALSVDLQGELASDPDLLLEFLGEPAQRYVAIDGLSARSLRMQGPLSLASRSAKRDATAESLHVHADIGWSLINVAGMQSPQGYLTAHWHNGEIVFVPMSVPLNGGSVRALPRIDLNADPRTLVLDPGPLAENVQFNPEICRGWMKYVSPLMADASSVSGQFSLASQGASFPLADMPNGRFQGVLSVNTAQVGPGPLAKQTIGVIEQVENLLKGRLPLPGGRRKENRQWLLLDRQDVQVHVVDGRVHHDRIEYRSGQTVVATSGSVGFDESLDLILEIPLQEKWLGRNGPLASLKGEVLRLPVHGTFQQPRVDLKPLTELNHRIATGTAEGLLQRLLGQ